MRSPTATTKSANPTRLKTIAIRVPDGLSLIPVRGVGLGRLKSLV